MNASGPISGNSSGLPKVMLRPESARMMKQVAVIQWTKRSKRVEAHDRAAGSAALDHHHAAHQIEDDQHGQHAEHGDGADPAQGDLMETGASRGLRAARAL